MVGYLFITVFCVGYPVYFLSRWGQTIGKMVAGVKVTRLDGSPIAPKHAWLRSSVDIGLNLIYLIAVSYVLATWTGPEWSSMNWSERGAELEKRSFVFITSYWASQAWLWSELVVLLLNKKRRALHDFIAGTLVVTVRLPGRVTFRTEDRQNRMGAAITYRIHEGPNAASAKAFLEQNPVSQPHYCIVVKTPEGNYCRDERGIYRE